MPADHLNRSLGTLRLALLVVAAVAPLAAAIGVLPGALVFGGSAALPLAFVVVALVIGLFSVGYAAISRALVEGGGFQTYIAHGLGTAPGLGAGWGAALAYAAFVPGGLGYVGYVMQTLAPDVLGFELDWLGFALMAWAVVAWLGYRRIDASVRLLALLVGLEFALLLVFDGGVLFHLGSAGFPAHALSVDAWLEGRPGVSLLLAFSCFLGVEAAALFSEEVRAPEKSVARATYLAVALIGLFYFLTAWIMVGAIGLGRLEALTEADVGLLFFQLGDRYLSGGFTLALQGALVTSMFATVLAIHNVTARYLFVLGRRRCLPQALGRVHARHGSPHVASLAVSCFALLVLGAAAYFRLHPMLGLGLNALAFATVGVMFL